MIERTAQCLELLDGCKMPATHKKLVRRNIMEIKKLLQSPSTAAKVEFFAKERFDALLADMQRVTGAHLKSAETYALVGAINTILKIARLVAVEEAEAGRSADAELKPANL